MKRKYFGRAGYIDHLTPFYLDHLAPVEFDHLKSVVLGTIISLF